jgi:hypothetical protein
MYARDDINNPFMACREWIMAEEIRKWYECKDDGRAFLFYPMHVYASEPIGSIFSRNYAEFLRDYSPRESCGIGNWRIPFWCFRFFPTDAFWERHRKLKEAVDSSTSPIFQEATKFPDRMRLRTAEKFHLSLGSMKQNERLGKIIARIILTLPLDHGACNAALRMKYV